MNDAILGKKICICTPDYVHLVRNGGIGTSFHHTAISLSRAGAQVTVLYVGDTKSLTEDEIAVAKLKCAQEHINLEILLDPTGIETARKTYHPNDHLTLTSYLAYQALKRRDFDIILFPDWCGVGYYSTMAKTQGLAFTDVALWVQAHSTSLWHALNNHASEYSEQDIRGFHMERKAIELCDRLISPTQYLLDWKKQHGFRLPADTRVMPYLIAPDLLSGQIEKLAASPESDRFEIVFFGRLEKRKGLHLFIQAIQRLIRLRQVSPDQIVITFLGKIAVVDHTSSVTYIDEALSGLGLSYRINPFLSSDEAVTYLRRMRNGTAVIASTADNSPLTVIECMYAGVPFVAANSGGIPEIIAATDHAAILFSPNPVELADRLLAACDNPPPPAHPAANVDDTLQVWIGSLTDLRQVRTPRKTPRKRKGQSAVSVCITHYERPQLLAKTLDGLVAQTCQDFDVIIVDDGSTSEAATAFFETIHTRYPALSIRLLHQKNRFVGAARNLALRVATSPFIIFMDDDNFARPDQIEVFLNAIQTSGYDALSCAAVAFEETHEPGDPAGVLHTYLPLGCGKAVNLFGNNYGDANGIYNRAALDAVGGFTEDYGLSWEDYELYSRLEQAGYRTGVVPEPLMYLRHTAGSVSRRGSMVGNYYRALRPALAHWPWDTYGDALLHALNTTLKATHSTFATPAPSPIERGLLSGDSHRLRIARLMMRKAISEGREKAARDQAVFQAKHGAGLEALWFDLLFLDHNLSESASLSHTAPAWLLPALEALSTKSLLPLQRLTEIHDVPAELANEMLYLIGLGHFSAGDAAGGFQAWSRMLLTEEADYLKNSRDVADAVNAGNLPSGLTHYLDHGRHEGRLWSYEPPVKIMLSSSDTLSDYGSRRMAVKHSPLWRRQKIASLLLKDIISSGSIIAAADLGRAVSSGRIGFPVNGRTVANIMSGLFQAYFSTTVRRR